jgi:hypothetical protein
MGIAGSGDKERRLERLKANPDRERRLYCGDMALRPCPSQPLPSITTALMGAQ